MTAGSERFRPLSRQVQFRARAVRWDRDLAPQGFAAELPAAGGAALRGSELEVGRREAAGDRIDSQPVDVATASVATGQSAG